MDAFLQNHSNLSFNALVDQEEDNGQLGQVEAPGFREPERPAKTCKKTKKSKKEKDKKEGEAEDSARRTTTESKDDSVDDNWQAQDDPYMTHQVDDQDLAEGAVCDDDEDDLPVVSKRAMQRAVKGFTRRSGGWKHSRKKHAAAGKGSAKGRGKIASPLAGSRKLFSLSVWSSPTQFNIVNLVNCLSVCDFQECSSPCCASVASA